MVNLKEIEGRAIRAAEGALYRQHYVSPIDVIQEAALREAQLSIKKSLSENALKNM